jgi:flagellin
VASNTPGLLSTEGDVPVLIQNGIDVSGTIGGEFAQGKGQVLTGSEPTKVSGVQVKYTGDLAPEGGFAGSVTIAQNSSIFQIGANYKQSTAFSLRSTGTKRLGNGILNDSGFKSLQQIDVTETQKALDTMKIVDRAIEEVSAFRGEMGAFQKNNLESNLNYLRTAHENLTNAESVIRDADMAEEMTNFTRNQIMVQSNTAMLAQANQTPNSVLTLLQGRA